MTLEIKILLGITYLISGAIVYSKNYGLTKLIRQILTWSPIPGIIYYLLIGKNPVESSFIFGLLTGPIVIGLLYELSDSICWKFNKRSFHLYAAGAKDMKGLGLPWDNHHYKKIDVLFSGILIMMWIGWPMLYVVIIHLTTK
jgi:hypothetical protein